MSSLLVLLQDQQGRLLWICIIHQVLKHRGRREVLVLKNALTLFIFYKAICGYILFSCRWSVNIFKTFIWGTDGICWGVKTLFLIKCWGNVKECVMSGDTGYRISLSDKICCEVSCLRTPNTQYPYRLMTVTQYTLFLCMAMGYILFQTVYTWRENLSTTKYKIQLHVKLWRKIT